MPVIARAAKPPAAILHTQECVFPFVRRAAVLPFYDDPRGPSPSVLAVGVARLP